MNKIEVLGGGFPGTSKTWRFIRDMINEVHDVAVALGGDNCIVKGCEVVNGVAADGIVIINGESYPFQGGDVGVNVEIVEAVEQVTYFTDADIDGLADLLDAYFERYARFAAAGTPWADLKRITPLSEVARRLPPLQTALPFWGALADIKDGWQLCDGSNGTPDLSGMFVVGYDPNDAAHDEPGKSGGESKHILLEAEMPNHDHAGNTAFSGNHSHSYLKAITGRGYRTQSDDNPFSNNVSAQTVASGSHTHSFTTAKKGGGTAHENRPKFYTMAWIAYVG